jgi:hypothetical protein
MRALSEKYLYTISLFTCVTVYSYADLEPKYTNLDLIESVSWTHPIIDPSSTGGKICYYSNNPTAVPFFFPKLVSIFDYMDHGDPNFYTLSELSKNPQLLPSLKLKKKSEPKISENKVVQSSYKIKSLEYKIRELEQKLFDAQSRPFYQPNDEELNAFINKGQNVVTAEQRIEYLTKIISQNSNLKFNIDRNLNQAPQKTDLVEPEIKQSTPSVDLVSIPLPPPMVDNMPSSNDSFRKVMNSKSVLRFKATVPTSQGTSRPAQASDFYLTTQNLQELLGELNIDRAVAGEVRSFAEIWAKAEKDSISNPEIALGVKSILLEAKVGKTRTDPFGKAELNGVSPDDQYYLIGIDKDISTGVVTIWSKNIEVAPGENMVELTSNDVIYQD